MAGSWEEGALIRGLEIAVTAYGESVINLRNLVLDQFDNPTYRKQCINELGIKKTKPLNTGLRRLAGLKSS